jgi:hypothetical protein
MGDATQITAKELARWNRAFNRIMQDLTAQVKVLTKAEIAALYPGGYPMDRLDKAEQTAEGYEKRKRGRPKQYNNQGF